MPLDNRLFKANFRQSLIIQKEYEPFIKNLYKKMGIHSILFQIFIAFGFSIIIYGLAFAMPDGFMNGNPSDVQVINGLNIKLAARIGHPLIFIPIITYFIWVMLWFALIVLRFSPLWNVKTFSFFGGIMLFQFSILLLFIMLPMIVGASIVGSGVIGFIFQIVTVITYCIYSIKTMTKQFLSSLYRNKYINTVNWKVVTSFVFIFIFLFLNSYYTKIGFITKEYDEYSIIYGWVFLLMGMGTTALIRYGVFKNFLCAFYFAKYSNQYRELWELTDEQWYGKGKARRIARKRARKNRKDKMLS